MSNAEMLVVAMWQGIFDWAIRKQRQETESPPIDDDEGEGSEKGPD